MLEPRRFLRQATEASITALRHSGKEDKEDRAIIRGILATVVAGPALVKKKSPSVALWVWQDFREPFPPSGERDTLGCLGWG
jgi:hypothetical protein